MLKAFGWDVEPRRPDALHLPPDVNARFRGLPLEYIQFLEQVRYCVNANGTAWFLTEEDFVGTADSAFRWGEFEIMSLEAAEDDSDLASSVVQFWDWHIPIAFSTKSGYSFLALSLVTANYGQIVLGYEPEFEDVEAVSASFSELLPLLRVAAVRGDQTRLSDFT